VVPKKFTSLPLGDVKPAGWVLDHVRTRPSSRCGFRSLLSHADTEWVSRTTKLDTVYTIEGAGSLWFNDMVTVAGVVGIPVVQSQVEQFLDYFIDSQSPDGWIGPEVNSSKPRQLSARFPFFSGAIRLAEAQPSRRDRVAIALHKFAALVNTMLYRGEGIDDDTWAFAGEFLVALQWLSRLYEVYPDRREDYLLDTMTTLLQGDRVWSHLFTEEVRSRLTIIDDGQLPDAGTYARAIRNVNAVVALGARYRLNGGQSAIHDSWDSLFDSQAEAAGMFVPYARQDYARSDQSGNAIDHMLISASYLYEVTGHPKFADSLERILYNAFWAVRWITTGWSVVERMDLCRGSYLEDGPYYDFVIYSSVHSCKVPSYPVGLPDFVYSGFLVTSDRTSVVQAHLGPFVLNTVLAGGNRVSITVDTAYPYGTGESRMTIVADKEFQYLVRVPSWLENATVSINGGEARGCAPVDGLHAMQIPPGTTKVILNVPIESRTERRGMGLVAVFQGPILYCLDPLAQDSEPSGGAPGTQEQLRYAIDPATVAAGTLPNQYFQLVPGMPRIKRSVVVAACPVAASTGFGAAIQNEGQSEVVCAGPVRNLTLTPYAVSRSSPWHRGCWF
ncbi:hypothetical protein OH77DRAFT_1550970, partial [Trametes cingulata]